MTPSTPDAQAVPVSPYDWLINHATREEFTAWCEEHGIPRLVVNFTEGTIKAVSATVAVVESKSA